MGLEIERKYLVKDNTWKEKKGVTIEQGYLSNEGDVSVRVRTKSGKGFVTFKSRRIGAKRIEFEYEIPFEDAQALLKLCNSNLIEKSRYIVIHDNDTWEIDEFYGKNDGLVIAEIELTSEDQDFKKPSWLGQEVTDDKKYYNSNLIDNPYCEWKK